MTAATGRKPAELDRKVFDPELDDLPAVPRWREWMGQIEAVLFAGATPVSREDLTRLHYMDLMASGPRSPRPRGRTYS